MQNKCNNVEMNKNTCAAKQNQKMHNSAIANCHGSCYHFCVLLVEPGRVQQRAASSRKLWTKFSFHVVSKFQSSIQLINIDLRFMGLQTARRLVLGPIPFPVFSNNIQLGNRRDTRSIAFMAFMTHVVAFHRYPFHPSTALTLRPPAISA